MHKQNYYFIIVKIIQKSEYYENKIKDLEEDLEVMIEDAKN